MIDVNACPEGACATGPTFAAPFRVSIERHTRTKAAATSPVVRLLENKWQPLVHYSRLKSPQCT